MQVEKRYKERYRKGDTSWGVGKPDFNLDAETVRGTWINYCKHKDQLLGFPNHRIVDAHAHLCDPVFDTDRPAVIKRARAAGVGAIIAVGENLSDAQRTCQCGDFH